jgi:hypothetical protein
MVSFVSDLFAMFLHAKPALHNLPLVLGARARKILHAIRADITNSDRRNRPIIWRAASSCGSTSLFTAARRRPTGLRVLLRLRYETHLLARPSRFQETEGAGKPCVRVDSEIYTLIRHCQYRIEYFPLLACYKHRVVESELFRNSFEVRIRYPWGS